MIYAGNPQKGKKGQEGLLIKYKENSSAKPKDVANPMALKGLYSSMSS